MFFLGTLSKWWRNRSRQIFTYWDGSRTRRVDPIVVGTKFEQKCPDRYELIEILFKNSEILPPGNMRNELLEKQKEAGEKLAKVSREVFEIKELTDTEGMTDGECIRVMTKFLHYMQGLAEAAQVFPTSPEAE